MAFFAFLPLGLLGGISIAVCVVLFSVEISERQRLRRHAAPVRRRFRPRVILGGKQDPAEPAVVEAPDSDKLAG